MGRGGESGALARVLGTLARKLAEGEARREYQLWLWQTHPSPIVKARVLVVRALPILVAFALLVAARYALRWLLSGD